SNLVAGDTNMVADVFVRDALLQTTERVSVTSSGVEGRVSSYAPSISGDGRFVAFHGSGLVSGPAPSSAQVYRRDRVLGTTELASVDSAGTPMGSTVSLRDLVAISGSGTVVAFACDATNLVPGDTNAADDVFVHDFSSGATERVSVSSSGAQAHGDSMNPS